MDMYLKTGPHPFASEALHRMRVFNHQSARLCQHAFRKKSFVKIGDPVSSAKQAGGGANSDARSLNLRGRSNSRARILTVHCDQQPPAGGTSDQKEQRCRLKMVISYDGSDFAGFQYQSPPARTVQATVEKAAWRIFGADAGRVVGASRTDGGVHAKAAVAHLDVPTQPSLAELDAALVGINLCLPPDVRIRKIEVAPDGFQAQRGSTGKIYHYLLATTCPPTPSESRFRFWTVPLWCAVNRKRPARLSDGALDVEAMRAAAEMIQGRRDFSALTEAKRPSGLGNKRRVPRPRGKNLDDRADHKRPERGMKGGGHVNRGVDATMFEDSDETYYFTPKSHIRNLYRIEILEDEAAPDGYLTIEMVGDGFLFRMCRKIVSMLVECGAGRISLAECESLIAAGDNKKTPPSAPGHGLHLVDVMY
ncbi:hypothetical protein CYMTET_50472 [Cymbomonas tetramitiformis]|uniref:tRNA pseudouridine synthase n=1 Tax=Cymbomonas tetramitiformis TaxID=36881 RepID=A0AAE0ETN6_9CHLO|nr:hypothetical protein CYMTET_50472 [Cymbomonas tetramitiformis]